MVILKTSMYTMKSFRLLIVSVLALSCISKQEAVSKNSSIEITKNCPDNGKCSLDITSNQSLELKKDDFGAVYPEFIESDLVLLKFEYVRNKIPNTEDSSYRELIYLELNPENMEVNLSDSNLKKVNAVFGRLCFCRGQTGHYKIRNGNLTVKKLNKDTYEIQFEFSVTEVPQVVRSIREVFSIK